MEQINLNKMIVKVALITLVVLVFIFTLVTMLFTFFYPAKLAQVANSLGLSNVSIFYYEKTYEKTQDINDLYRLLNQTILANKPNKVIENYEKLYDNNSQTYNDFIAYMNNYYMTSTENVLLQIHLTNEDLRLKKSYIQALFKTNALEKAFLFTIDDLQNEQFLSINDYNKLNFLGASYVFELNKITFNVENYEVFENYVLNDIEINYLQQIMVYYNQIKDIYDFNLFVREEYENSFELLSICNHLQKTATTMLFLDNMIDASVDTSNLQSHLNEYFLQYNLLLEELETPQQ